MCRFIVFCAVDALVRVSAPLELSGCGGGCRSPLVCWLAHPWFFGGVGLLVIISAALAHARNPPSEAVEEDCSAVPVADEKQGT